MSVHFIRDAAAVVWLSGEDRLSFLERMSTNRLTDLQRGEGKATCVLTDIGRVVDLVGVHSGAEGVVLITSAVPAADTITSQLRRYVLFRDDVRVTNAASQVSVLRLVGQTAGSLAARVTGLEAQALAPGSWLSRDGDEGSTWVVRHPMPGGLRGWDVVVPAGAATKRMTEALTSAGAIDSEPTQLDAIRVTDALPKWGAEIDGKANPLELGLEALVDAEKGCYIGQEVVARLDTYDKVQRRIVRLVVVEPSDAMTTDAAVRAEREGRVVGRVTTVDPTSNGRRALAMLPVALIGAGTVAVAARDGGFVSARIESCHRSRDMESAGT